MNKEAIKQYGYKAMQYIAIYIVITMYMQSKFEFENWHYVGNIGAASIVYLIIYLGSDSVSYRLKEDSKWKERMEKLKISKGETIFHVVLAVLSLAVALYLDMR